MKAIAKNPGKLEISETFTGEDLKTGRGWRSDSSGWYEPYTEDLGRLYKSLRKEYGRCVSRVYIDTPDGQPDAIGWVFAKKVQYTDSPDYYNQEVWVTYRWV